MNITLDPQTEDYIAAAVRDGRYASASALVAEGIKHLEVRDAKIAEVRKIIQDSIAEGGSYTIDDVRFSVKETLEELRLQGYP